MRNETELKEAVGRELDKRAVNSRNQNNNELKVKAGEFQKAIGAVGIVRRVCACLEDDQLLSVAGLELKNRVGPPGHLETVFRYKVLGVA